MLKGGDSGVNVVMLHLENEKETTQQFFLDSRGR
jgi:hypothetical protein